MFPPGRARLATSPFSTAFAATAMTIGIVLVASLAAWVTPGRRHNEINLEANQLLGHNGIAVPLTCCPPVLDGDVLALDPAKIAQGLQEGFIAGTESCAVAQVADPRHLPRLLRLDGQRPGKQSDDKDTNKPDGSEPQNRLLYCYKATNITGERVVNRSKTQLNDALIESWTAGFI